MSNEIRTILLEGFDVIDYEGDNIDSWEEMLKLKVSGRVNKILLNVDGEYLLANPDLILFEN